MDTLRLLLNLVWLVLQGWVLALAYALAGVLACLLIVTIPFGIAAFRLAFFVIWPFGRTTVRAPDAGVASAVGNLLWFLVAGWWLALLHIVAGIGFCLTIIGIPFGVASFKLAAVGLFPLGKRVVENTPPRDWMHAGGGVVGGAPGRAAVAR
ncbi:YccF domain-containing protein [Blastococcus saxobsidens]|uniref:YccF domain-containing protein n=1 Tax=Blastococcus saxobsidens TaxID=138336 RepID=UPI0003029D38|nr:YccF domain-containing protein [Blastococcus saxobsidens]